MQQKLIKKTLEDLNTNEIYTDKNITRKWFYDKKIH